MSGTLYIFGTGAHARKVAQCAVGAGWTIGAFIDEAAGANSPMDGIQVIGAQHLGAPEPGQAIFVAIGRAAVRRRLMDDLDARNWPLPALVHRTAWVAPDARLADGVLVGAQAVVETQAHVGRGAIVDIGALVDHDARVGEYCHLHPGTVVASYGEVAAAMPD